MIQYIAKGWKSILKIGYNPTLSGLERSRTMLINGLTVATSITVFFFLVGYKIIGLKYYWIVIFFFPPAAFLVYLNHKRKYKAARALYVVGSISIVSYWCYMTPGNGNEYILIAIATTSSVIFNQKVMAYLINFICLAIFIAVKAYVVYYPFTPDPSINYNVLPTAILLGTVAVLSFQMAFFRDLVHHYDNKLSDRYEELNNALELQQRTDEELMTTNEELTASNEQLYMLSNQLEVIVKQKSVELQSYVDAINVNIHSAVTDSKGIILKANGPLLNASGYLEEELLGKSFNMFSSGDQVNGYFTDFWETVLAGKTWRGEIKNRKKDGSIFWTDTVILPVKNEKDSINYFLTLSLPITERKLHEESREKTIQLIETVAFRTSHNIRGPLTRIQGLTDLIQNDLVTVEEFKWVANKIFIGTQEIDRVTSELVEFVNTHQSSIQEVEVL
jgi:PAS domain S-box-containing protein